MPPPQISQWVRSINVRDIVWLSLCGALAYTMSGNPDVLPLAWGPFAGLTAVQLLEPRIPGLSSRRGQILWIAIKLLLGFLFIGWTQGINSRYWLVLLLPVAYSGTIFGMLGTLAVAFMAAASYGVFLLYVDWSQFTLDWSDATELILRTVFLAMMGILAHTLAADLRVQNEKYRRAMEQLAEADVQVQEAEEAVRRSDRLAALGQLSAGLAHELRNPLGTIKASSEMLAKNVAAENEVAREVAGFITTEVDRANSLITRFLQFARPLQVQLDTADLAQTLDHAIGMVEREAPGISIYRNYAPEIPPFPFDAELMERVFYNLILNAAQASAEQGTVTVKTRAAEGTAEIAVIDRGAGIDPKHLDTIFNPFFTTKPTGVGLGLAIVSKIVDEHGGKIAVESQLGKGSVFRVLLPMTPAPAAG